VKVSFRADASLTIGTGHVMRCLTLARELRGQGVTCRFICRTLPGNMVAQVAKAGFEVTLLPKPDGPITNSPTTHAAWAGVDWQIDAAETRAVMERIPSDWLVMDHYAFDARWQQVALPDSTKLMVIDDLADRPHNCDLILDQNLRQGSLNYDGLVSDRSVQLMGPKYALLRPEFADARAKALVDRVDRGLRHLLITMGGVDLADATSTILIALRDAPLPDNLRITVIMGSGAPALERVRAIAKDLPWPTAVVVDVPNMASYMALADIAISAGGGTTWERCCLGLPSIIVETAQNQAGIARDLATIGAAWDPGPIQSMDFVHKLHVALSECQTATCLDEISERAAAVCDGDGAKRILATLIPFKLHFRDATSKDSRRVWEWRNAIKKSLLRINKDTSYYQHDRWFRQALGDNDRIIRIVMKAELPCGYLRLDRIDGSCACISICLSPEARGQGLGPLLLEEANKVGKRMGIEYLSAEVHHENAASRRAFEHAGYSQGDTVDGFLNFYRNL
tara:strand:- start:6176 stop:7705 length:1530 start_codon:yes stop_codon:yes gene_type:complete